MRFRISFRVWGGLCGCVESAYFSPWDLFYVVTVSISDEIELFSRTNMFTTSLVSDESIQEIS